MNQLSPVFPGITEVDQTPLAAFWESGSPRKAAWGKKAREMTAEILGIEAKELQSKIVDESPYYRKLDR